MKMLPFKLVIALLLFCLNAFGMYKQLLGGDPEIDGDSLPPSETAQLFKDIADGWKDQFVYDPRELTFSHQNSFACQFCNYKLNTKDLTYVKRVRAELEHFGNYHQAKIKPFPLVEETEKSTIFNISFSARPTNIDTDLTDEDIQKQIRLKQVRRFYYNPTGTSFCTVPKDGKGILFTCPICNGNFLFEEQSSSTVSKLVRHFANTHEAKLKSVQIGGKNTFRLIEITLTN